MCVICPICNKNAPLIFDKVLHKNYYYCLNCGANQQEMVNAVIEQNQKLFVLME